MRNQQLANAIRRRHGKSIKYRVERYVNKKQKKVLIELRRLHAKKNKQCALKRINASQGNALFAINNKIAHYYAVKKKINDALTLYRNSGVQTNMEWHHQKDKNSGKMSYPEIRKGCCLPLYTSEHILISTVHDVFSSPSKEKGECYPIDLEICWWRQIVGK